MTCSEAEATDGTYLETDGKYLEMDRTSGRGFLKGFVFIISAVVTATGLPATAQTQECIQRSEQLLKQLGSAPARSTDAMAEKHRQDLRSENCDPQRTGYDLGVESMKLNQELGTRPDEKTPFRFDQLIRIQY